MLKEKAIKQKGAVLIIAIVTLGVMLFLGGYFLSFSLTGSRMASAQEIGTTAYFLAESGIAEALFKLQNDADWKAAFETLPTPGDPTCSSWSIAPYTRDPALAAGGSYAVSVTNLGCAQAQITATATVDLSSEASAKRVVKMSVFKAMGSPVSEFDIFLGGPAENLFIRATNPLNVHGGSLFSNKAIRVKDESVVNVDDKALAGQNITIDFGSQLNATSCASNVCDVGCDVTADCPPAPVSMPPIDFNSAEPDSYLSEATNDNCASIRSDGKTNCVFTPSEFEKVMWDNYPAFSLPNNVVVYITGDFNLRGGQDLTVNGVLVADRDVNIGEDECWARAEPPFSRCGSSRLVIVRPGVPGDNFSAGLLASRKFNAGEWLDIGGVALDIHGLVYSGDEMSFASVVGSIEVRGALAARKVSFSSMQGGVDIYLEPDVIVDTFRDPEYSPVITIDHWEEEY